ncbi:MAG TPA: hypothetical protein VIM51_12945 [Desulfosporosinus sp.]
MHKAELLKQLSDILTNGIDVKKVKITYKNGEAMKIAFDDNDTEVKEDDNVIVEGKIENKDVIQETGWKVQETGWKVTVNK